MIFKKKGSKLKNLKLISAYFTILTLTIFFISCGESPKDKIIGQWSTISYEAPGEVGRKLEPITFNNDGTVVWPPETTVMEWEVINFEKDKLEIKIYKYKEDKEKRKAKYHMIADASTPDILSVKFPQLGEGGPSLTLRRIEQ